jgi:hypothetical protein
MPRFYYSGESSPDKVFGRHKILDSGDYAFGYNAQTGQYGDLVKQGRHRSGQGGAHGAAGCGVRRWPPRYHRGHGGREAEAENSADTSWWQCGRYGLLAGFSWSFRKAA